MNSPRMMDHTIENPYQLRRLPISEVVDTEHEQVWKSPTKLIVTVRFIIQYACFLFGGYSSNMFKMTVFQDGASVVHQKTATKPPARVPSWPGEWGCLAGTLWGVPKHAAQPWGMAMDNGPWSQLPQKTRSTRASARSTHNCLHASAKHHAR